LSRPTLAVFDLDGTLTTRDTSLPFISFARGRSRLVRSMAAVLPFLVMDLSVAFKREIGVAGHRLGRVWGRREVEFHQRLLRAMFQGMEEEEFLALGRRFAAEAMDAMVSPGGLEQVAWHRARGHECILVTASIDCYVEPWGRRVGFDKVLGSRMAVDALARVQGGFEGEPCWGEAKFRRLRDAVGPLAGYTVVVYGNEPGDLALLARADHAVRVRAGDSWPRLSAEVRSALKGD
jgi:phosphatidylglycerophosphatase C